MITQKQLIDKFYYNPDTGIFTRRKDGRIAGCMKPTGYIVIMINGKFYYAHRLAWIYVNESIGLPMIDHINRNKSDNRITNLRPATASQNQMNKDINKSNSSGIKGVTWNKARENWEAHVRREGKRVFFKRYKTIGEAKQALVQFSAQNNFYSCI